MLFGQNASVFTTNVGWCKQLRSWSKQESQASFMCHRDREGQFHTASIVENQPPRTAGIRKRGMKDGLKQLDKAGGYSRQWAGAEDSRRATEFVGKPAINDIFN